MDLILSHWGLILTVVFAILASFKISFTAKQKKAITDLWDDVRDIIEAYEAKGEKVSADEVYKQVKTNEHLKPILSKINNTKGHNAYDVVTTLVNNYSIIKTVGGGAWKLAKGFLKLF